MLNILFSSLFVVCLSINHLEVTQTSHILPEENHEEDPYYPFMVSIQYNSGKKVEHVCSGTILSQYWILTAAHCVCYPYTSNIVSPEKVHIIAGLDSLEGLNVSDTSYSTQAKLIHIYPNYDFKNFIHDIALIQFEVPLDFSVVQSIHLATNIDMDTLSQKEDATVALGWSEGFIHEVFLNTLENKECAQLHDINLGHFCAISNYHDDQEDNLCQEESGGPLIYDDIQFGVASFILSCGMNNIPNIFTRTDFYITWMEQVTNISFLPTVNIEQQAFFTGRRPGGGGGGWRPGGGGGWRPGGHRPGGWRPGGHRPGGWRPGGHRPGGNRPGGNRPGGHRPGAWRPGGRPGSFGGRPGGSWAYRPTGAYINRGAYVRRYGGYGYYGIRYRPYIHGWGYYPMGIWWGRPILFYYRPWFFLDFYLWHWYFWHPYYHYHGCYGYGYAGYGGYRNYMHNPPAAYMASYCMKQNPTSTESTPKQRSIQSTSSISSSTLENEALNYKRFKRDDKEGNKEFYILPCKEEVPKFYTGDFKTAEEACEKDKIFCKPPPRGKGSAQTIKYKINYLVMTSILILGY